MGVATTQRAVSKSSAGREQIANDPETIFAETNDLLQKLFVSRSSTTQSSNRTCKGRHSTDNLRKGTRLYSPNPPCFARGDISLHCPCPNISVLKPTGKPQHLRGRLGAPSQHHLDGRNRHNCIRLQPCRHCRWHTIFLASHGAWERANNPHICKSFIETVSLRQIERWVMNGHTSGFFKPHLRSSSGSKVLIALYMHGSSFFIVPAHCKLKQVPRFPSEDIF